ncbi:MAG: rhomboid family intramembrane serine protease [Gammaproteobacteria bacterium]|nr:MAG: rhomboid family intramembrane serine protease [Gammaproteobacteria bacterium]
MFPLSDENQTLRLPLVTAAIIAINAAIWIFVQGLGADRALGTSVCQFGLIPADLLGIAEPGTHVQISRDLVCVIDGNSHPSAAITSMFMHGGWFHILGNMWFLWVFGDNVEDVMGRLRFAVFYLICGLAAAFAQIVTDPSSITPMVGASGAIGGVMGAYAFLFPRIRVNTFIFLGFYMTTVAIPAVFMLGYWFLLQLLGALPALTQNSAGGVAFWAHIGGFLAGIVLVKLFVNDRYLAQHRRHTHRLVSRHRLW